MGIRWTCGGAAASLAFINNIVNRKAELFHYPRSIQRKCPGLGKWEMALGEELARAHLSRRFPSPNQKRTEVQTTAEGINS